MHSTSKTDFSRTRKLPLSRIFSFILSISSNGGNKGLGIKISEFFRNASRTNLIEDLASVNKSSIIKARNKIPHEEFSDVMDQAVKIAYDNFPKSKKYQWKDLSVYAVDGSKYTLPSSDVLRDEFDPKSGFDNEKNKSGKGHYPQCLVSTIYDVFRRIPIARSIATVNSSEREEFNALLGKIPDNGLFVFDRGYPSYEMFYNLKNQYHGYFLFRNPISNTFKEVTDFLKTGQTDGIILLRPGVNFKKKYRLEIKKNDIIKLRIIISTKENGEKNIFLTNLFDKVLFQAKDISNLYYKRWEVEVGYRNEKESIDIESFHSKNPNGVKQELYAVAIMTIIARTITAMTTDEEDIDSKEPQLKNAIITLANDAAIFIGTNIKRSIKILKQIINDIKRQLYYRPKKKRKNYPRITKRAINKWIKGRSKVIVNP